MDNLVSRLVDTLFNLMKEELDLQLGVPEEIQKLRKMLCSIQDVLNDSEQQQITRPDVKRWLSRLTDVMYDADDILDEYRIVAEEQASRKHPSEKTFLGFRIPPLFACCCQVKFTHEIGYRIRDLNKTLEEISAIRSTLSLTVSDGQKQVSRVGHKASQDVEPDITGEAIEKDTRDLVNLLLKEENDRKVVVLAIVGTGGIGKTTLAQKIFNDYEIQAAFQNNMMWLCVSQEFVEKDLLIEMITSAGASPGEDRSIPQLKTKLKTVLKDRKFFLVLDDIWDVQIWEDLLYKPLQEGAAVGSRVLVTTRDHGVANRMKAVHLHNVNPLPLDDSWLLLCKKVTKNAEEERFVQSLKDIGEVILKKCDGLPLAIKAIGGVLCGKLSRWEWEQVERSSAWEQTGLPEGVHRALYLSYQDLPPHLKQCFLHCSLFREDADLFTEDLMQLWIAEGFVVKAEGFSLEQIAKRYCNELLERSLLQNIEEGIYFRSNSCKMHDLLRSMCHFLAKGESSVIRDISKGLPSDVDVDSKKLRRLSIVAPEYVEIKPFLRLTQSHKSVRTLFLNKLTTLDDKDVEDCFNNFQHLRVVDLSFTNIQSLPQSIGNQLHLRYLNLFCCDITVLPESITSLKNLQFLILRKCHNLKTLPKGVVELSNLRTLDLHRTSLEELPSGIARLKNLQELSGAVVSSISSNKSCTHSSLSSLEEIIKLCELRRLTIKLEMTSVETDSDVNGLNKSLTALTHLETLGLFCSSPRYDSKDEMISYTAETDRIGKIFDVALRPPSSVLHIIISNFFGRQFPRWLISSNLDSLINLSLIGCHSCSVLPPLGKLPSLEFLILQSLDAVTSIGAEFFGYEEGSTSFVQESGELKIASSRELFPRLKRLHLVQLGNLEAWHWVPEDREIVAMLQLKELVVEHCSKLLSLPEGLKRQAIKLIQLSIKRNNIECISGFPSLKKLSIFDEPNLKIVSHLPVLKELNVRLPLEQSYSLPDWLMQSLPHLSFERLQVTSQVTHENLQLLYQYLPNGPIWPQISNIPVVQISFDNYYIYYNKYSSTFRTNII